MQGMVRNHRSVLTPSLGVASLASDQHYHLKTRKMDLSIKTKIDSFQMILE